MKKDTLNPYETISASTISSVKMWNITDWVLAREGTPKAKISLSDLLTVVSADVLFQIIIIKRGPIKRFSFVRWMMLFYNMAK